MKKVKKFIAVMMCLMLTGLTGISAFAETEIEAYNSKLDAIEQAYQEVTLKAESGAKPDEVYYDGGKTTLVYSVEIMDGERAFLEYSEETIQNVSSNTSQKYALRAIGYGAARIAVGEVRQISFKYSDTLFGGSMTLTVQVGRLTLNTFLAFLPSAYVVPPPGATVTYYNAAVTEMSDNKDYAVVEGTASIATPLVDVYSTWQMKLVIEPTTTGVGYELWTNME